MLLPSRDQVVIPRFNEPLKLLPLVFTLCLMFGLWYIYAGWYITPLLENPETRLRGRITETVFNIIAVMMFFCYCRAVLQHPGTIPEKEKESGDPSWEYTPRDTSNVAVRALRERKQWGDKRVCKWCNKYKPDRSHHCRVCRMCILKMDHHCPWVYNCVGFRNQKFFVLFIFYASVALNVVTWTMLESLHVVLHDPTMPFFDMFMVIFGVLLSFVVGVSLTTFWIFHVYLMLKAMTTIEFCEKTRRAAFDTDAYNLGYIGNIKAVLGDNPFTWLLPMCPPTGDGLTFVNEDPLSASIDSGRGIRRSLHQDVGRMCYSAASA